MVLFCTILFTNWLLGEEKVEIEGWIHESAIPPVKTTAGTTVDTSSVPPAESTLVPSATEASSRPSTAVEPGPEISTETMVIRSILEVFFINIGFRNLLKER